MVDQPRKSSAVARVSAFRRWRRWSVNQKYMSLLLGMLATGGILTLRSLGAFQVWELHTFDWMMSRRLPERPDERIVIIGITEDDIETTANAAISDTMVADVIEAVKAQRPTVIGMDLFRNVPRDEGYQRLQQIFHQTPNLIGIEKVIDDVALSSVSGNAILAEKHQVAASDLIVDVDGRIRRGFLFPSADGNRVIEGLAFRVALDYLASHDIYPNPNSEVLELGYARLPPVEKNSGGYSNTDAGGYQILMNWRANLDFKTFSALEAIQGQIPPGTLRDKIVLIGSMQSADADVFFTPYSYRQNAPNLLPSHGIQIHASLASEIVSLAFGQRNPIKVLPTAIEFWLIAIFAWLGIWLYRLGRSDIDRLRILALGDITTIGACYILLMFAGWWLPVVPMSLSLVAAPLIARLHKLNRLQTLSQIDELTQLANRRKFQTHLTQVWQRAMRSHTPVSLILCDVDYFKRYNDTYGHPKGDECLRQVAHAIGEAVRRPDDLAARYGGEEFVILLPNTNAEGAQQVAKDAAAHVSSLKITHQSSEVSPHVTISLGVTTVFPSPGVAANTLVDTADLGLYEAKRRGRNQMVLRLPWSIE